MRQTLENIYYQYSAFSIFFFFFFSEYLNPLEVWFLAIAGRQSWWRPKIIEIRSCPSFLLLTNCFFLEKLGWEHSLKGLFTVSTTQKGKCRPWSRGFMGRLLFFLMYLFLAVLGLCCCEDFSLVVVSGGYRVPTAVASLVAKHGL